MPTKKLQVDPGSLHWGLATIDAVVELQQFRVLDVLVTNEAGRGFQQYREYCGGYPDAAAHLAAATALRMRHRGSFSWDAYPEQWTLGAPAGRSGFVQMPANVDYSPIDGVDANGRYVSNGLLKQLPMDVFEGAVEVDGRPISMRLLLEFSGADLTRVTWFHDGGERVRYLLPAESFVLLVKRRVCWLEGGWRQWSGVPTAWDG